MRTWDRLNLIMSAVLRPSATHAYMGQTRWSPTSKKCNQCGYIKQDLALDDREWDCPSCHVHHIRDVNAAKNIHDEGMELLKKMSSNCKKCGRKRTIITKDTAWTCTKCNAKNK